MHRVAACVNALRGIEDPGPFVWDVKRLVEDLSSGCLNGEEAWRRAKVIEKRCLKGEAP